MRQKFDIIESTCVPLPLENVDTDQIIPARFLKATTKDEKFFGDALFRDWRFDREGNPKPEFVLNRPEFSAEPSEGVHQILVAGKNFAPVRAASTPPGQSPAMASEWLSPAFSLTSTKIMS